MGNPLHAPPDLAGRRGLLTTRPHTRINRSTPMLNPLRPGLRRGPLFGAALVALVGAARAQPRIEEPLFKPAPGSPIAVAGFPGNIALGDVNQDGKPDLVVASGPGFTVPPGSRSSRAARSPSRVRASHAPARLSDSIPSCQRPAMAG